jgi:hypothetical protein
MTTTVKKKDVEVGTTLTTDEPIMFKQAKTKLSKQALAQVAELAEAAKDASRIVVIGHSAAIGEISKYSYAISRDRANAVKAALVKAGVKATIEVVALPIRVPIVGEWFRWNELTPDIQKYVLDGKIIGGQGYFSSKSQASGNFQEIVGTSGEQSFDALSLWLPQIKDRASANPSTWTFYNLGDWELAEASRCISGATDLVGLVTTNASVYAAGTPSFNVKNQSLDYKVMAPHLTSKGEIFQGEY